MDYVAWFNAAIEGDIRAIESAIDNGIDPDARTDRGRTALMLAAWHGHDGVVRALIAAGADLDEQRDDLAVPVDMDMNLEALSEDDDDYDDDGVDGLDYVDGFTRLMDAVEASDYDDLEHDGPLYIEREEIDSDDYDMRTALHHAVAAGHVRIARRLVDAGAVIDPAQWSAELLAVANEATEYLESLIGATSGRE